MPLSLLSPVIVVMSAIILIALERLFPYDDRQPFLRSGFVNDLALYAIIQSYVLGYLIFYLVSWFDKRTGLSHLHLIRAWPLFLQVTLFLVTHDCYIYWFHRLQHHSSMLWRIHEAHHSTTEVDWLSGARSHSIEILINQTVEFAPIILLGAAPEVILIKGILDTTWGMYIHSNINVKTGALQYVINGPEMHRWHHAREITGRGVNFGTKLAFWDWIFGTAYLPRPKKPSAYGLEGVDFPSNYFLQHLFAFRPFNDFPSANKTKEYSPESIQASEID